jgi:hypothetical protein
MTEHFKSLTFNFAEHVVVVSVARDQFRAPVKVLVVAVVHVRVLLQRFLADALLNRRDTGHHFV